MKRLVSDDKVDVELKGQDFGEDVDLGQQRLGILSREELTRRTFQVLEFGDGCPNRADKSLECSIAIGLGCQGMLKKLAVRRCQE